MKGLEIYRSKSGFRVCRIHYTADPKKDPATREGKAWYRNAVRGYPGGTLSSGWRQEMEIDWEAAGGDLVLPALQLWRDKIVVVPFDIPEGWRLFGSFDYGHRNPSAFHVHAIDYDGDIWTVWEYYKAGQGYRKIANAIRACPHWEALSFPPIADPSIFAQTQQASNNEVKSIGQLFTELPEDEAVFFVPGKKGGDITAAEKINGELWKDLEKREPRWRIFATCPMLIWELNKLRFSDWSGTTAVLRNYREEIVDKDNHAWDGFKMFLNQFFTSPDEEQEDPYAKLKRIDPASYQEWKRMAERQEEKRTANFGEWD